MIDQIRHLQSCEPFETFALELTTGRVIQIHDRYQVATGEGTHHEDAVIGVLHKSGAFELINAGQIASVSIGVHPLDQAKLDARTAEVDKIQTQDHPPDP